MSTEFVHEPVLLQGVLEHLCLKTDGVYVDGTAGGAGHSSEIAKRLSGGMLYAFDRDPTAVAVATERLAPYSATVIKGNYRDAAGILKSRGVTQVDGILLDLGVSSHQLDTPQRGFSYNHDAPLDMRMGEGGITAYDIVNEYPQRELQQILFRYADEKNAGFISRKIVAAREKQPIATTLELAEVVKSALPAAVLRKEKNPAKKTFQALRIAVNDEMGALNEGLHELFDLLKSGGRMCVITFHSLEDKEVKRYFKSLCEGCTCPKHLPLCVCGNTPKAKMPIKYLSADEQELSRNRRAHSAKLRVLEKL